MLLLGCTTPEVAQHVTDAGGEDRSDADGSRPSTPEEPTDSSRENHICEPECGPNKWCVDGQCREQAVTAIGPFAAEATVSVSRPVIHAESTYVAFTLEQSGSGARDFRYEDLHVAAPATGATTVVVKVDGYGHLLWARETGGTIYPQLAASAHRVCVSSFDDGTSAVTCWRHDGEADVTFAAPLGTMLFDQQEHLIIVEAGRDAQGQDTAQAHWYAPTGEVLARYEPSVVPAPSMIPRHDGSVLVSGSLLSATEVGGVRVVPHAQLDTYFAAIVESDGTARWARTFAHYEIFPANMNMVGGGEPVLLARITYPSELWAFDGFEIRTPEGGYLYAALDPATGDTRSVDSIPESKLSPKLESIGPAALGTLAFQATHASVVAGIEITEAAPTAPAFVLTRASSDGSPWATSIQSNGPTTLWGVDVNATTAVALLAGHPVQAGGVELAVESAAHRSFWLLRFSAEVAQ